MGSRTARWADVQAMAQTAEAVGFDTLWLPDRLFLPVNDEVGGGQWECTTLLAAIAAVTSRIEIGAAVLRSIYRNPALLAARAATIDEISGGRLILGMGTGDDEGDSFIYGYPTDYRYSRFEETLQITLGLLRTGHTDFQGRFYQVHECELRLRGLHPQGRPLMMAAVKLKMMRLAAQLADLCNVLLMSS